MGTVTVALGAFLIIVSFTWWVTCEKRELALDDREAGLDIREHQHNQLQQILERRSDWLDRRAMELNDKEARIDRYAQGLIDSAEAQQMLTNQAIVYANDVLDALNTEGPN